MDTHLSRQVQLEGGNGKLGSLSPGGDPMTSIPRPALLGLIGVVLVAGLFLMTRKHSNTESASSPAPATTTPAPAPPATGTGTGTAAPETTKPATPKENLDQARTLPEPVDKALKDHKVVVLLIWNPKGVDDRKVKSAVDGLSTHGGKVAIFHDDLKNLARYTTITAPANVSQTPTLIVTNSKAEARVATGYLDPTTVEQYVTDALHGAP